jgi:N-acetylneuraminic acid mutarotase
VYDISDDTWTVLADLPQTLPERNHLAATAINGKVYAAGGRYGGANFASPLTESLDIYDPATDTWQSGAPLPRARGGVNGILAFGCFHVWGGEGQGIGEPNDVFPDHDVYDPRSDVWVSVAALPTPVHGVTGAAFVDGLIYIPGGGTTSGGSSGVTLFQVYRPDLTCES